MQKAKRRGRWTPVAGEMPAAAAALIKRVLFRDDAMLVLDKPAGLPVHAGPKGGATLDALLPWLAFGKGRPPGLAHRLDRDTSGCLVLGRTKPALARLGELFAKGAVGKTYMALVQDAPGLADGRIDLPLIKRSAARGWWMEPSEQGQAAVTDIRVIARGEKVALVEARPRTGRTHQIRVHLKALGAPLLGDAIYGSDRSASRLMLHARSIEIPWLPGAVVRAEAPFPADFRAALLRHGLGTAVS
ncbi:MAG TPA: RNA pseudouridine synthase [Geminicoccus sp.]|jgi:RluA family pseudouridine synthase|uniref:RluA family pseudouridine synthase n=1 Tax=Geminicoccus sp. TaxID=2024832 RepID=UPI002E36C6EC|nr:RNA pseudouridine synthase [Geminicoccus sp.]HEX2528393.1 RNA pseudouridine synthase [Geminicoccus sp.]